MNLNNVKQFMSQVHWGSLATTDGRKVGVRPMGGWAWFDEELWFASGKATEKVRQVKKVRYAECIFSKADGEHVRIAGPCFISANNRDKLKLFNAVPLLKDYIDDPTDHDYVVIRMRVARLRWMKSSSMEYTEVKM